MELITDYQIYKELLHRYKDHIATLNTNSIIMPETYMPSAFFEKIFQGR